VGGTGLSGEAGGASGSFWSSRSLRASSELGTYLFFGQLTQLLGLGGSSATTNAILVQSSVVVIALLDPVDQRANRGISPWLAVPQKLAPSLLALGGIALITVAPGDEEGSAEQANTPTGIALCLASAVFYAMHTLRLSEYADVDATTQAAGQVSVNALLDVLALPLAECVGAGSSSLRWARHAHADIRERLVLAALWNGLLVVAATTWAMSYAQQAVAPSIAALAYATEPLFAAAFAALLLGEKLGPLTLVGGALVVAANAMAAVGVRTCARPLCSCRSHGGGDGDEDEDGDGDGDGHDGSAGGENGETGGGVTRVTSSRAGKVVDEEIAVAPIAAG